MSATNTQFKLRFKPDVLRGTYSKRQSSVIKKKLVLSQSEAAESSLQASAAAEKRHFKRHLVDT